MRLHPRARRVTPEATRCQLGTLFKLKLFLPLSCLFVVTAGALALADNLLLGLRGARAQLLGASGLLLRDGGLLGGFLAQSIGFRSQFLSPGGMGVCLLTVSGGV